MSASPYDRGIVRRMEATAKITSKSQLTLPKAVREALDAKTGDTVVFRVDRDGVRVSRAARLDALAGAVRVPESKRGTPWDDVVRRTRSARGRSQR